MAEKSFGMFRPMQPGDSGWWYSNHEHREFVSESRRWYINPRTGEIIPLRQYQNLQRGTTYTQYRRQQEKKGIPKQRRKPRKQKAPPPPKPTKPKIGEYPPKTHPVVSSQNIPIIDHRRVKAIRDADAARDRRDYLQEAWARKRSQEYGVDLEFKDLPDIDKTEFWHYYDEIVNSGGPPSLEEYEDQYQDYFDLEYDDFYDIEYGDTP